MDSTAFRSYIGDTISFTYWDGTAYQQGTAQYSGTETVSGLWSENSSDVIVNGAVVLKYYATGVNYKNTQGYVTIDASPLYSITNTTQVHAFIGVSTHNIISSDTYNSPQWDWSFGHIENRDESASNSGYQAYFKITHSSIYFPFVEVNRTFDSPSSCYSSTCVFYGNTSGGYNNLTIAVGVPYVSSGASGASGTLPPAETTTQNNINVNIDLTDTNQELETQTGIISSILSWASSFFSNLTTTVRNWFVPSENFLDNWVDELLDIIEEKFVPHTALNGQLENIASDLAFALGQGGVQAVQFPALSVPGTDFSMPAYSVPLVPNGMESSVEYLKVMIDCLCTVWVFNMVLNRVHALIVGETAVEVIDNVD